MYLKIFLLWFDHFLDPWAEICQIFRWLFGKFKKSKRHSEIIWPLRVCNKWFPNHVCFFNYRNGRWRSVWTVQLESGRAEVSGLLKVQVHYYEDGNIQLVSSKEIKEGVTFSVRYFWRRSFAYLWGILGNGTSCSFILPPLVSPIFFRCLIFDCYNISICKKGKVKDERSKKIRETNKGQIKEQDIPLTRVGLEKLRIDFNWFLCLNNHHNEVWIFLK